MALTAGSVTVDAQLARTGTGLALALYDAEAGQFTALSVSTSSKRTLLDGLAGRSTRLAAALIDYLKANAEVTVSISNADTGLQMTTNPGVPTGPHVLPAPIVLATKGTIA